jgi:nucleoside-diphosphate-sugar epimerase
MPRALIFGGTGKVARRLTTLLRSKNPPWEVYSIIRDPSQNESLSETGANPILQSIEESSVEELQGTIAQTKPDVVVWSAGAGGKGGPQRTDAVDRQGAIKVFDALRPGDRFIMVSAVDVRDRENKPQPEWYDGGDVQRSEMMWGSIGHYMRAKYAADRDLRVNNEKRGLKYTIVRPGGLNDEPGKGMVAAGKVHIEKMISRDDVAATILACIQNEGTIGLAFDVVGGETSIEEAVRSVAEKKEDCFEGYYQA